MVAMLLFSAIVSMLDTRRLDLLRLVWLFLAVTLVACSTEDSTQMATGAGGGVTTSAGAGGHGGGDGAPAILSAYFGLDNALPLAANGLCLGAAGEDGMPIVLRDQLPNQPIDETIFEVETANGSVTSMVCATLAPALDATELRTVLLVGAFGTAPDDEPVRVAITGSLVTQNGNDLQGASIDIVTPLAEGSRLVVAERFAADAIAGACPPTAQQAIQLTWQGGVTAAGGAPLGDAARQAVTVLVEDESSMVPVTPIALGDLDNDNYVVACLDDDRLAVQVDVAAGAFHDPGDDPNPATSVPVTEPPF